jgi:hypothetical protein
VEDFSFWRKLGVVQALWIFLILVCHGFPNADEA